MEAEEYKPSSAHGGKTVLNILACQHKTNKLQI
jgi:hypothetical protein